MAKRLALILAVLSLTLTACGDPYETRRFIDEQADVFGDGKSESDYYLQTSEDLLDDLIDKYAGSYHIPDNKPLTDDEYEDLKKDDEEDEDEDDYDEDEGWYDDEDDEDYDDEDEDGDEDYDEDIAEISDMKQLIRLFHQAYDDTAKSVEFRTLNGYSVDFGTDLQYVYTELQREDPIDASGVSRWLHWSSGDKYYVEIEYAFDVEQLKQMKQETRQLVNDAVKNIVTRNNMTDYEKVDAMNEYLCDTVYYPPNEPYEPVTHTAYGALKNGCAVCEGYACAAKLILSECGVESDIECGDTAGGGHAWNLVKLEGEWYQLDVTWNDGGDVKSRKNYFLVTDEFMKQSRIWDEARYPVSADEPYSAKSGG